jgi:hypothetical protein
MRDCLRYVREGFVQMDSVEWEGGCPDRTYTIGQMPRMSNARWIDPTFV